MERKKDRIAWYLLLKFCFVFRSYCSSISNANLKLQDEILSFFLIWLVADGKSTFLSYSFHRLSFNLISQCSSFFLATESSLFSRICFMIHKLLLALFNFVDPLLFFSVTIPCIWNMGNLNLCFPLWSGEEIVSSVTSAFQTRFVFKMVS